MRPGLQKKIAEAAGVTAPYVNQVVNFKKPVKTWETAKKFAQLTNTDPADWLEDRRDVLSAALDRLTLEEVDANAREECQACRIAS
jgi:transcriptional regulator with XRE-family HTH domain